MQRITRVSPLQFAVFRIVFGLYLAVHFFLLVPFSAELFSNAGMISNPDLNLTAGVFPNPLARWDSPAVIEGTVIALGILSVLLAAGICRRTVAFLLWFGWAALFNRNNLILNPSIPYIGLLLLLTILIPLGEPTILRRGRSANWFMPGGVYWCAWILMAAGYSFSGWTKLSSPSWIDGSVLLHVLENPLARPGMIRAWLLQLPPDLLRWATWCALLAEISFLPLIIQRHARAVAWGGMCLLHGGILLVVDFADLTIGMLMIHIFTFDPDWGRLLRTKLCPRALWIGQFERFERGTGKLESA